MELASQILRLFVLSITIISVTYIGHKMAGSIDKHSKTFSSKQFFGQRITNSIYIEDTSEDEIIDIINKLNQSKAPGYDDIPTKLIKAAKFSLALSLTIFLIPALIMGCI